MGTKRPGKESNDLANERNGLCKLEKIKDGTVRKTNEQERAAFPEMDGSYRLTPFYDFILCPG